MKVLKKSWRPNYVILSRKLKVQFSELPNFDALPNFHTIRIMTAGCIYSVSVDYYNSLRISKLKNRSNLNQSHLSTSYAYLIWICLIY